MFKMHLILLIQLIIRGFSCAVIPGGKITLLVTQLIEFNMSQLNILSSTLTDIKFNYTRTRPINIDHSLEA